jgi:protein phosphatase
MAKKGVSMIELVAAALTDTGLEREVNEDSVWAEVHQTPEEEPLGLFVVCDGMGGHMGGEFASYWAVEAIKSELADLFLSKDPRATVVLTNDDVEAVRAGTFKPRKPAEIDTEARVRAALQKANHVVYQYARHKPQQAADAGTTVTMAVVVGERAVIANVGDSRTYLLRDNQLRQISKDHSLVGTLVAEGAILPDEIYTHPQRNVIFRFLGQQGLVQPDIFYETLQPGDYLLLCSDGLWEMVRNDRLTIHLVKDSKDPMHACEELVESANMAGGEDNISVIVVKVS